MRDGRLTVLMASMAVAVLLWSVMIAPAAKPQADADQGGLDVRYARLQLQLAEANLQRVQRSNQRVAGAVPDEVANQYQEDVEIAKTRLQDALRGAAGDPMAVWLRAAEAAVRHAESQWKNALAANRRMPGTVDSIDTERLRLRSELAGLELERGRALVGKSSEAQLQWQVNVLHDQVRRLNEAVLRNPPSGRIYPIWGY